MDGGREPEPAHGRSATGYRAHMSDHDARAQRPPESIDPAAPDYRSVDDVPAARLLAHDLEHLVWDDEDDRLLPPPD